MLTVRNLFNTLDESVQDHLNAEFPGELERLGDCEIEFHRLSFNEDVRPFPECPAASIEALQPLMNRMLDKWDRSCPDVG